MRKPTWVLFLLVGFIGLAGASSAQDRRESPPKTTGMPSSIGPEMVWDAPDNTLLRIRKECASAANPRSCLIAVMKKSGASAQAVAFSRRLAGGIGYLESFDKQGPIDIAKVAYPLLKSNPAEAVLLVNGKPPVIRVSDLTYFRKINIRRHKLYSALTGIRRGLRIWRDEPGNPIVQPGIEDRTEVEIRFPVKSCRRCKAAGYAVVIYDFGDTGRILGVRLKDLVEQ